MPNHSPTSPPPSAEGGLDRFGPQSDNFWEILKYLHDAEVSWGIDDECCVDVLVYVGSTFDKRIFERAFARQDFDEIGPWMLEAGKKVIGMERGDVADQA